jgi:hypothetical protein
MAIELNHTIVAAHDAEASARWLAEMFGLPEPSRAGHFWQVDTANGVALDFSSGGDGEIRGVHYAFLVAEEDFDAIYGRIVERGMEHWPAPNRERQGEINHHDGGRGVYFLSNDGHFLEIITVPYGGWS